MKLSSSRNGIKKHKSVKKVLLIDEMLQIRGGTTNDDKGGVVEN